MYIKHFVAIILVFVSVVFLPTSGYSITSEDDSTQQAVRPLHKNDVVIDVSGGFPFFFGELLKTALVDSSGNSSGVKVVSSRSVPHLGIRIEKMVTNQIGLGMEATYADINVDFIDSNNSSYSMGLSSQRYLFKLNYHIDMYQMFNMDNSKYLDPYVTMGIGYRIYKVKAGSNSTLSHYEDVLFSSLPISLRTSIGLRYFFIPKAALTAELGLGGPLIQFGLSYKL